MWDARRSWTCMVVCLLIWMQRGVKAACTMAQFPCRNQQCVGLDKYCDGVKNCKDGSDEPSGCSPCNRTYYGKVGATYKIKVPKPRRGSLPHFCQLTFMASGEQYGDLIQLSIEKFNLGRFSSHTTNGCPDGYMQIEELSRPSNAGYWCGSSWGHNVYYSETSSVSVMIRVFNLSEQIAMRPRTGPAEENILLQLSYRYLIQEKAVLRYGVPYSPSFLGDDVAGTFCDKIFDNCDKKNCKIQSPNYPGMYPRNLTCYYHIKQTYIPDDKIALIRIRQKNPHLIYIKDRNAPHLSRDVNFQLQESCHVLHDYIMIFDGNSTKDSILLKACKGGKLSPLTASGANMLLLFHVSPYDYPFQDTPRRRIFGFQLEVEVLMVGKESTAYIRKRDNLAHPSTLYPAVPISSLPSCQWEITSRGQRSGYVQAPAHSILANTTCVWRLLAGHSEIVWLYFLHYRQVKHKEMPNHSQCPNTLSIYDGDVVSENATLLGQFCKKDKYPKVCSGVHAPGAVGATAPCPPSESYVSLSSALTLNLRYKVGTIPAHIEFLARYEFVDQRKWGDPTPNGNECDRTFRFTSNRLFASPKDIFLFGRGGNRRLKCTYIFKAAKHERIYLKIYKSKVGNGCSTLLMDSSLRYECSHGGDDSFASIKIKEEIWPGVHLNRACLCNISDRSPLIVKSYTNVIRLILNLPSMTASDDFYDFFFEGEYQIVEAKRQLLCNTSLRQYEGKYGNFSVGVNTASNPCNSLPRIINAQDGAFLYLKAEGYLLDEKHCKTDSRINIYGVGKSLPIASICPNREDVSAIAFSNGWHADKETRNRLNFQQLDFYGMNKHNLSQSIWTSNILGSRRSKMPPMLSVSRDLIIEYVGNSSGDYLITWVGVWKPIRTAPISSARADLCPHQCPEIKACLPEELWCDGTAHCPSEIDEGASACGILAALPWVSLIVGLALVGSLLILLAAVMRHRKKTKEIVDKSPEVTSLQNNGHGVKSATQELLIPSDNDTAW